MENNKENSTLAKFFLAKGNIPRASYIMHIVVGIFMFYIVYSLITSGDTTVGPEIMVLACVFFIVCAVYFIAGALYALKNGLYREAAEQAADAEAEVQAVDAEAEMQFDDTEKEDVSDTEPDNAASEEEIMDQEMKK